MHTLIRKNEKLGVIIQDAKGQMIVSQRASINLNDSSPRVAKSCMCCDGSLKIFLRMGIQSLILERDALEVFNNFSKENSN